MMPGLQFRGFRGEIFHQFTVSLPKKNLRLKHVLRDGFANKLITRIAKRFSLTERFV
jgi:hypothetical protein